MFLESYKKAIAIIMKKPLVLWGLSLMYGLLTLLAIIFLGLIPAVAIAVVYLLTFGMTKVFMDGYDEKEVHADQLFEGFNKNCFRIAGGMAWRDLWILIWALVPFVGPIIAVVKSYSYRFVPYIMANDPEVKATEALRISQKMTEGIKGEMFLADLCFFGAVFVISFVLTLLSAIPFLGAIFALVYLVFSIIVAAFSSIFTGLYQTYFFKTKNQQM